MVEQVNAGTLEIAHTALGGLVGFMPELQVIELPYVIRDDMVAECMIDGPFFEDVRKGFLEKSGNVNLIGVGNTGRFRNFFTASAPVKSADDLKGVKMRVINSQLPVTMMEYFGGNPTPVAWGELYTSLATGVVEGTKNAVTDIIPNKMDEVLRYSTLDEHAYLWGFMAVSQSFLDSMPDDLKSANRRWHPPDGRRPARVQQGRRRPADSRLRRRRRRGLCTDRRGDGDLPRGEGADGQVVCRPVRQ